MLGLGQAVQHLLDGNFVRDCGREFAAPINEATP